MSCSLTHNTGAELAGWSSSAGGTVWNVQVYLALAKGGICGAQ